MSESCYFMPAEWSSHRGTLVSWPSNPETWEGIEHEIKESAALLAAVVSGREMLYLSVKPSDDKNEINTLLGRYGAGMKNIRLLDIPNNDAWTRDYGPNYVTRVNNGKIEFAINNWGYNAWGGKYPPWNDDNIFKIKFAEWIGCKKIFEPGMILEGGSIDVNGGGVVLTTESCLLNPNRNPGLDKTEIESRLKKFLGVEDIVWIKDGIAGDDTDGHIDDFVRFADHENIICSYEENKNDENYPFLSEAYDTLCSHPVLRNRKIKIHKFPMPAPKFFRDMRLPASYANFYFVRNALLVPVFNDPGDDKALSILAGLRPDLSVIPVPGLNFVRGLGGIHCLTQQIY